MPEVWVGAFRRTSTRSNRAPCSRWRCLTGIMERATASRTKLRTLIVDDEELARKALVRVLRTESDIEVVAECAEGAVALQRIAELSPDLVFLDIRMRGMS